MNGTYDRGSMGVMVFDKDQLIPISQNGVPIENDEIATDSKEPVFLMSENTNEKFVENAGKNEIDSLEYNGYNENANEGLTKLEKEQIKEKTGWSDAIVDYIRSIEEAQIYIDADLKEAEINGRKCLIRSDIDMEQVDETGITNFERIKRGMSPYAKNGEEIQLHHIGQKTNSPLAELTKSEHLGKGNYSILHDIKKASEIDRIKFTPERKKHWGIRFNIGGNKSKNGYY